jgi:hypothetical protein
MSNAEHTENPRPTADRFTRLALGSIAVLLGLLVLGLWMQASPLSGTAWGAPDPAGRTVQPILPDSGAQFQAMVGELKNLNAKVDELSKLLTSGKVKVTIVGAEGKGEEPVHASAPANNS